MMKRHIIVAVCANCLLICLMSISGYSAGLSIADNQVFPHGYLDFDHAGALSLCDYPFATMGGRFSLQTSYRSLYGMRDLNDARIGASFKRKGLTFSTSAAIFGRGEYFQQIGLGISAGYRYRFLSFGASSLYSRVSFNDSYSALDCFSANTGIGLHFRNMIVYGVTRTINQPRYTTNSGRFPITAEIGISYKTGEYLESQAKAQFDKYHKPTAQILQAVRLAKYAGVSYGLILSPVRVTAGVKLEKNHLGFEYQFSHHPVLGMTHNLLFSVH